MAPHAAAAAAAARRRAHNNKQLLCCRSSKLEEAPMEFEPEKKIINKADNGEGSAGCSTPKAERFRIPDILSCPPAPKKKMKKKKRVAGNCSLRRSAMAFYAHPDLELFFFHALGNISA